MVISGNYAGGWGDGVGIKTRVFVYRRFEKLKFSSRIKSDISLVNFILHSIRKCFKMSKHKGSEIVHGNAKRSASWAKVIPFSASNAKPPLIHGTFD